MKIHKAKGAPTNTYRAEIEAMSVGMQIMSYHRINAEVMFTSDDGHGETLSIYDSISKRAIVLPFESISQLVTFVRSKRCGKERD